jgi:hypothetical protein
MNLYDWYFKMLVSQGHLDQAFAWAQQADYDIVVDNDMVGINDGGTVVEQSPTPDLTVNVSALTAYGKTGERIAITDPVTVVDASQDEYGTSTSVPSSGDERIVSVFVRFKADLEEPKIDGNGLTVYSKIFETAELFVRMGDTATVGSATPPAIMTDALLLADITLVYNQTQILNSDISYARREDWVRETGTTITSFAHGSAHDAIIDLFGHVDGLVSAVPVFDIYNTIGTAVSPGELRQNVGAAGSVAYAQGFSSANDGGGGFFNWVVDASPPADDGGTIIVPTGTPGGYWMRMFDGRVYNAKWFGIDRSIADNGPTINTLLTTIGSDVATIVFPHDKDVSATVYTIDTDVTVPSNVTFYFQPGARISVNSGDTLANNGSIEAHPMQYIFSGAGTVEFGDTITESYPEWFGAAGNGTTDDTSALQNAANALIDDEQGTVIITNIYKITGTVDIGGRSIVGVGKYAEIKNDDADSYVLMSGAGASVDDTKYARFENILITLTSSATIGLNVRRRRVYGRNFRIVGVATNSQKALYFDVSAEAQTFHDFDDFSLTGCDYPIFIYTNSQPYYFNSSKVGSMNCYITSFVDGITINGGMTGCSVNQFGGYFEGGTNMVVFEGSYTQNNFFTNIDTVTYLIKTNATIGGQGNRYHIYSSAAYTLNPAGTGTSYYDLIYATQGMVTNRRQNYIISSLGTAWWGMSAAQDDPAGPDVAIELSRNDSTAAAKDWRKFGSLGLIYNNEAIFYCSYSTGQWKAKILRNNAVIRRNLNERFDNYTILLETDHYLTIDATGGNRTLTLPAADDGKGVTYKIKRVDSSGNTVTISPDGSDTVEGGASMSMSAGQVAELVSDGTSNWVDFGG